MPEEWRTISVAQQYEVSNHGGVRFARTKALRVQNPHSSGHLYVTLAIGARSRPRKGFSVHRLVLTAFAGPPPTPTHEVRHIDGNPANNTVTNLTWGTRSENIWDQVLHHGTFPLAKLTPRQAEEIRRRYLPRVNGIALAKEFDISLATLSRVVHNQRYLWSLDQQVNDKQGDLGWGGMPPATAENTRPV